MMQVRHLISWVVLMMTFPCCLATDWGSASSQPVRKAAVAGQFYPADQGRLKSAIQYFLDDAVEPIGAKPVGLVVPHAGYIYSGQIAADGYRQAQDRNYDLVVVLGPNHTTAGFRGISVYRAGSFETPLGRARIDSELADDLIKSSELVVFHEGVHRKEHSIEVQLPFVQTLFPDALILPVIVATEDAVTCERFGQILAEKVRGRRVLIVASSDLSHYPAYDEAVDFDLATIKAVAGLEPGPLQALWDGSNASIRLSTRACGAAPMMVVISAVRGLGCKSAIPISYANSGDTSVGTHDRVVGYGAVAFFEEISKDARALRRTVAIKPPEDTSLEISQRERRELLTIARTTLNRYFESETTPLIRQQEVPLSYRTGAFVTLRNREKLRGCIGHMIPDLPMGQAVAYTAMQAAFNDRRFTPITATELPSIDITVSILTPERPIRSFEEIRLGTDGVILTKNDRSAVFLPEVPIEQGWNRDEMLEALSIKAGLSRDDWKSGASLEVFQSIAFSESELAEKPEVVQ